MKKILVVVLVALSINGFAQQAVKQEPSSIVKELVWHTDVNKAIKLSVETGKPLFLFFTGSDWCGWCKKLVREVFVKQEFEAWATKNAILVEIDFPKRTPISDDLKKQNRELGQMFGVRGYPTGWFVIPQPENGKVNFNKLGSQGYVAGGPTAWIAGANKILKNK
jgi:protein disulfide-isomerase